MAENSFQPFTRRQTMIRRDFEIYRYRYMDEVELHHHDFYEIYMLLRGSVSYTVENRIFHMRAGDLMLISPLELHQARVDSNDEPYERMVLWVDRGYLESLSSPHTSLTRCFDTTVPGHTNLLRLPGPRSAAMRRELGKLGSARDVNPDMMRQGMLLLSYPCIESFIGMNLLDNSLAYCWNKGVQNGHQLKQALNQDGALANKITQETLIKSVEALITALNTVGVNTQADELLNSLDRFADNNRKVYDWQEEQRRQKGGYGLLSLMAIALLDLGLIQSAEDE